MDLRAEPPLAAGADRLRVRLARWLAAAGVALIAGLLLAGLAARGGGDFAAGAPAPSFDLPLLSGGRVTSAGLAGRVVVLNVWASWCPPCRDEAPVLQRVFASSDPARVAFLGVAHDDTASGARGFVRRFDVGYPNALDNGSLGRAYGVRGLPTTYVIGANGALLDRHFGPISESTLRALIADAEARTLPPAGASATAGGGG